MENPWMGLASYGDPNNNKDKRLFCGRDNATAKLNSTITSNVIVTLYGRSGIGKTSLLNAGVFPALRKRSYFPVSVRLSRLDCAEGGLAESVIRYVKDELKSAKIEFFLNPAADAKYKEIEFLNKEGETNKNCLVDFFYTRKFIDSNGVEVFPVLAFDQFEELFRLSGVEDFLKQLNALTTESFDNPIGFNDYINYRLVLSIREDELYLLEDAITKLNLYELKGARLRLEQLTDEEAEEIITKPGADVLPRDDGERGIVINKILNAAKDEKKENINTLMLSLICSELFKKAFAADAAAPQISVVMIDQLGHNILHDFYLDIVSGIPETERVFLEDNLVDLNRMRNSVNIGMIKQGCPSWRLLTEGTNRILQETNGKVELVHDQLALAMFEVRRKRQEEERLNLLEQEKLRAEKEREREQSIKAQCQALMNELNVTKNRADAEKEMLMQKKDNMCNWLIMLGVVVAFLIAITIYQYVRIQVMERQIEGNMSSMKKILFWAMMLVSPLCVSAQDGMEGTKTTFNVELMRDSNKSATSYTRFWVNTDVLCEVFNQASLTALNGCIASKNIQLQAIQSGTGTSTETATYGSVGYWFDAAGEVVRSTSSTRCIACKYEDGCFKLVHNTGKVEVGEEFSFVEMFVSGADTVEYRFHLTMGDEDRLLATTQPHNEGRFKGRPDATDAWPVKPLVTQNADAPMTQNYIQVMEGDKITLDCQLPEGATPMSFAWKKKTKVLKTASKTSDWVIEQAKKSDAGYYVLSGRYSLDGKTTLIKDCYYYVDVQTEPAGTPFSWEGVVPPFSHDWSTDSKYNYGVFEKPTKILGDVPATDRYGKPTQWVEGEWWAVCWGSDLNKEVGPAYDSEEVRKCAENMVKKFDEDFAYIRDYMHWPPDLRARNGYKSLIYIFGSGLKCDNTPNTEMGGYQGAIWYSDPKTGISANWPCVWASYLPFSRFRDDADRKWSDGEYQREAMVHEGIHAIFADLGACSGSAWFHEAGNTWLQSAMNTERYDKYGTPGFLDACPFIAPFMPIECYSGWLQDGSFGGPTAQGVNMFNSSGQQICTWRNLLGGTQYGNAFPIILSEIVGKGAIPWIWRNCTDYVLKGIGTKLGEETMRQLILQYRSRMALFDIGGWKKGYRSVTNGNFGVTVKAEWAPFWIDVAPFKLTMYQGLTKNSHDGWMAPDELTNPGWSGANIIPIHVDSKASTAVVEFRPEDTEMRAQLCYVTKSGVCYYSQPVHCGAMQIDITDRPANNVIFCVVANTDYIFVNDEKQRKKHWDYRIRMREGALQVAALYAKWNMNETTINESGYTERTARDEREAIEELINTTTAITVPAATFALGDKAFVQLSATRVARGGNLCVNLQGMETTAVYCDIVAMSGTVLGTERLLPDATLPIPSGISKGLHLLRFRAHGRSNVVKVMIE